MDYNDLLKKAYEKLPKVKTEEERFEIPQVEIMIQGNQTIIKNFAQISQKLRREPKHLLKYLTKELAAPGSVDQTRATLQRKLYKDEIQKKINSYVKDYVICRECGKPDTKLEKEGRIVILKCEACGARLGVR